MLKIQVKVYQQTGCLTKINIQILEPPLLSKIQGIIGIQKKLNEKMLAFNSMLSNRRINTNSSVFKNYEQEINKKLF
jgi:hypothetical protein